MASCRSESFASTTISCGCSSAGWYWCWWGGEGLDRAGSNAVVFMSGLYALRGAAVAAFFGAGQSLLSVVFLVLALMFVWPVVAIGALVIGLGDTWLDLRARARAKTA